jgi:hypothetical protein
MADQSPALSSPVPSQPFAGAPYSPTPYSAVPYSVTPMPEAASAPARRSRAAIVFGVLAALLLLGAGGLTAVYLKDRNAAQKHSAEQQAKIDDLQQDLDRTKTRLANANRENGEVNAELLVAKSDLITAKTGCPKAVQDYYDLVKRVVGAGRPANDPEIVAGASTMLKGCNVKL